MASVLAENFTNSIHILRDLICIAVRLQHQPGWVRPGSCRRTHAFCDTTANEPWAPLPVLQPLSESEPQAMPFMSQEGLADIMGLSGCLGGIQSRSPTRDSPAARATRSRPLLSSERPHGAGPAVHLQTVPPTTQPNPTGLCLPLPARITSLPKQRHAPALPQHTAHQCGSTVLQSPGTFEVSTR